MKPFQQYEEIPRMVEEQMHPKLKAEIETESQYPDVKQYKFLERVETNNEEKNIRYDRSYIIANLPHNHTLGSNTSNIWLMIIEEEK